MIRRSTRLVCSGIKSSLVGSRSVSTVSLDRGNLLWSKSLRMPNDCSAIGSQGRILIGKNDLAEHQVKSLSTLVAIAQSDYQQSETLNSGDDNQNQRWTPQLTKIVATIGPTSEQFDVLQDVVKGGMRIMRLNFSHATTEEVELRVSNLQKCKVRF